MEHMLKLEMGALRQRLGIHSTSQGSIEQMDTPAIIRYLEILNGKPQKDQADQWLIRLYLQIAIIVGDFIDKERFYKMKEMEEEIWNDITSEKSYLCNGDKLQKI